MKALALTGQLQCFFLFFTATEFNTSGSLCVAALCPLASTSASGPVVLMHLTVTETAELNSRSTQHSTVLDIFHIVYSKYTFI